MTDFSKKDEVGLGFYKSITVKRTNLKILPKHAQGSSPKN